MNLNHQYSLQSIGNKCFKLKQDVFLYKKNSEELDINSPSNSSWLPLSIDDFEKFGENWNYSDSYLKKYKDPERYERKEVVGVLKTGTKLHFIKILKTYNSWGISDLIRL